MRTSSAQILLVEDNPGDQRLTVEALQEAGHEGRLQLTSDGQEALDFLNSIRDSGGENPKLIILDLDLPTKDGREVLAEIKQDPDLRAIPVVVFSSSDASEVIDDLFRLEASGFITKPIDLDSYYGAIASLQTYWESGSPKSDKT